MTVFNVVTGYSADNTGTNDCTMAFKNAINAANAAATSGHADGGAIVYAPAGLYKFTTRYDSQNFPDRILPKLDSGVTLRGEGANTSRLNATINYDLITVDGGSFCGVEDIGFFPSVVLTGGAQIRLRNSDRALIRNVHVCDTGFAYGNNGQVWVTGQYTAATGRANVGVRIHGSSGFKNHLQDVIVDGGVVGFEVGTYNTSSDWPQGVTFTHCLAGRTEYGFAVYAGDAIRLIDSGSLQCKNNGLLILGKSGQAANVDLIDCGFDTSGDHGIKFDSSLSGTSYHTYMNNVWSSNNGHPSVRAAGTWGASKGILLQSGIERFDAINLNCNVNGDDGAEITASVHALVELSKFNDNGQKAANGAFACSGLYIPPGCVSPILRNNLFDGAAFSSYSAKQSYGLYVSASLAGVVLMGNVSKSHPNGQDYNFGTASSAPVGNYNNF